MPIRNLRTTGGRSKGQHSAHRNSGANNHQAMAEDQPANRPTLSGVSEITLT